MKMTLCRRKKKKSNEKIKKKITIERKENYQFEIKHSFSCTFHMFKLKRILFILTTYIKLCEIKHNIKIREIMIRK